VAINTDGHRYIQILAAINVQDRKGERLFHTVISFAKGWTEPLYV